MTQRVAYFDCFSGASGDMLLGAWLDAGYPFEELKAGLAHLGLVDCELAATRRTSHGITGTKLDVLDRGHDRPAHNLGAIHRILDASGLCPEVLDASLLVFSRIAEAEAAVHGVPVGEIHFHELGAVDSLVDIVGFNLAVHDLGIEALYASPLPLGRGTIHTEHGLLPVPAPATLALLAAAHAPTLPSPAQSELVTPTGAALLGTLATFSQPAMTVQQVGYGLGSKEFAWANVLRVWIGDTLADSHPAHTHDHAHDQEHDHEHEHAHEHEHEHSHESAD